MVKFEEIKKGLVTYSRGENAIFYYIDRKGDSVRALEFVWTDDGYKTSIYDITIPKEDWFSPIDENIVDAKKLRDAVKKIFSSSVLDVEIYPYRGRGQH